MCSEKIRAWAWVPDLEEAFGARPRPDDGEWYPAKVRVEDEAAGELLLFIYTYNEGEAGEEFWTANLRMGLEDAEVMVWPRDEPPPVEHKAALHLWLSPSRQPGEDG